MDRRRFFTLSAAAAAYSALPLAAPTANPPDPSPATTLGSLHFVFFTDTHLQLLSSQPLKAPPAGPPQRSSPSSPPLCIQGGDHCLGHDLVPRERSLMLLDSLSKNRASPRRHPRAPRHRQSRHLRPCEPKSGIALHRPPLRQSRPSSSAFQHQATYRLPSDEKGYHYHHPRLHWHHAQARVRCRHRLRTQLAEVAQESRLLAATLRHPHHRHKPRPHRLCRFFALQVRRPRPIEPLTVRRLSGPHQPPCLPARQPGSDVLSIFEGHNVIAVLQGHTAINETVYWRNIPFITSGAVCGNWWNGSRWGTPARWKASPPSS